MAIGDAAGGKGLEVVPSTALVRDTHTRINQKGDELAAEIQQRGEDVQAIYVQLGEKMNRATGDDIRLGWNGRLTLFINGTYIGRIVTD
jgi:epoxyqueuosine reductase QueG